MRLLFLAGLTFLMLLPFAGKAFHIDDPLFVWAAKNIEARPLDPYGFDVNWYGFPMRMSEVTKNPPLTSYYIAGFARLFGWGERTLHLAFLIPAIVVILGTYLIAERLSPRPLLASLCTLFTPAFLVSGSDVMSDTLMLGLWVSAVFLWITGLRRHSPVRLTVSGVLVALSAMAKYFGMALIPLLFVYTLLDQRRLRWTMAYLLLPVLILAGYQWTTHELYGRGLLSDAAAYATGAPSQHGKWSVEKLLIGLAFTGGCLGAVWLYTVWVWRRWAMVAGAVIGATLLLTIVTTHGIGGQRLGVRPEYIWMVAILFALFVTGGLSVLALSIVEAVRRRDADSMLLSIWVLGTFFFAAIVNWSTNGRSILPMVPAAAILIARQLGLRGRRVPGAGQTAGVACCAALVALAVAWADLGHANSAREAARKIHEKYGGKTSRLLFEGHWGFQFYMEALGAKALDVRSNQVSEGDILVLPENNTNIYRGLKTWTSPVETLEFPSSRWIATMQPDLGAGFYADVCGPLPFAVGNVPVEKYEILRVSLSGRR